MFAGLGVRKLRLTGGEPLLRRDVERLVAMLREIDGIEDIALTTNGSLLARKADVAGATPGSTGSRSASTRSTTRCSGS